jgi:AraC family transcriptional regulator of arabinose operon
LRHSFNTGSDEKPQVVRCAIDRRIARTIDFLRDEWKEPGRLKEIAARVGLSSSRLTHLFTESAQVSIRAFIQERRLRHAAELLATSDERIGQIAYAVGFRDASNFNHRFKRMFGVSPKVYRLGARGDGNQQS